MQAWKISVGLTAVILALALMLASSSPSLRHDKGCYRTICWINFCP